MNYHEAISYISSTKKFGVNLGLDRTYKMLKLLDNPQDKIKCIHIAGTNGKGSTAAMITEILLTAGYKVGMYTSPYIEEFEERVQIDGQNILKDDLSKVVTEVSHAAEKVLKMGYDNPTEFEIITCAMFLYFYKKKVDIAVIEVGLGGRLDSTNVLQSFKVLNNSAGVILSIITSVSCDHMKVLGNTIDKIAFEKAGIIKEGVPVILYPQDEKVQKVIQDECYKKNSRLIKVPNSCAKFIRNNDNFKQNVIVKTCSDVYNIELSLLGQHQVLNCAAVILACEELINYGLKIKKEHIIKALKNVKWIGRLEVLNKKPLTVIDGAHNVDGIKNLVGSVKRHFKYNHMILIIGILADKQVNKMLEMIAPMAQKVLAVTPNNIRAESASELKDAVKKYNLNCEAFDDYREAYDRAVSSCKLDDLLLICGSLYMIGGMRKIIIDKDK
ncbi:folylpolyglutamate synthase/dihydrofolate synthase family protein [Clostridium sp. JN-1]|uniref:bifunctional folylpolyglutamate synthase/dihydrofolate synthase n=1 Tax=Clostridium sp. JN-1 TaxID=2483110 RepID=UPI000F0B994F|nr:folylpolyglutamate synthase/dihydrofolate synthase family protein [Clostridium sp. JN-1]